MVKSMADYRREYGNLVLTKEAVSSSPLEQFNTWFEDIVKTDNYDPTAMVLSTVDEHGAADSRVVLLKGILDGRFIFYTNYGSSKASQIFNNSQVALNFFWPYLARQVRIRGLASKVDESISDNYFSSRPKLSQIAAHSSNQSHVIDSRVSLEAKMNELISEYSGQPVIRPENWGGFGVLPTEVEFWQGRDNRLHDRLVYSNVNSAWIIERLAP